MTRVSETVDDSANLAGAPPSMDAITVLLPSINVETQTSTPPPSESNLTTQQQQQPDNTTNNTLAGGDLPPEPPFIDSINGLRTLSTALSTFLRRYDELHDHLNFIKTAIESKLPNHMETDIPNPNECVTSVTEASVVVDTVTDVPETMAEERNPNGIATDCGGNSESMDISENSEGIDTTLKKDEEETEISKKPDVLSELESYCEQMCGREMKKYVIRHIYDTNRLREEIPKALKLASDPAKLVLEGIGRFFTQGRISFSEGSQLSVLRLASVVILECFLMITSDGIKIAKLEEERAEKSAVIWRNRMIKEGGLAKADEIDARGLLLFISGFGIPNVFKNEDIRDLIRVSNVKKISSALCRSTILIQKIQVVINWMMKNNLGTEAADIACTFGLEDKCRPVKTLLHNKDMEANGSVSFNETQTYNGGSHENATKPERPDILEKPEETDNSNRPAVSELESYCELMCGRELRAYVTKHISDMDKLRKEIPKALKLSKNPAKWVLEGVGRFFLQGTRSYSEGLKATVVRLAAVLILECFVMISSDGIEIAKEEEEYAAKAAIDWRKRMIKEGGLANTDEVDARGLLLLISGFGIPDVFTYEDVRDLIRAAKAKKFSSALRRSSILIPKIPVVMDWMVKNNLETEAADIACTFGLEDKCGPVKIFLHNKAKDLQHGFSAQVDMEANGCVSFNGTQTNSGRSHENVTKPESPDFSEKPEETDKSNRPGMSELESCFERMCGREMRAYVTRHISNMNKLRKEIPEALKLSKNPAKWVLEGVGRFFLQGIRSFSEGSKMTVVRLAAVVILECFVMISSEGIEIAKEEEEYAAKAAVDWRKRMIKEGGLAKTDEVDARGLLLLISGFGIPDVFTNEDIRDLIRAAEVKKISSALRRSIILIPKIPEVIDWMVKNDLEIEAADIAYTFGLEDKCRPQTILTTFLHNKINDKQHGSSALANAKKQLWNLKSIRRCLESHNVDPSKPLADYKINERIEQLEKEINELDSISVEENPSRKRKVKEAESSRNHKHEMKRTRLSSHENPTPEPVPVEYHAKSPYNRSTRSGTSSYFDRKLPSDYLGAYPISSVLGAPGPLGNVTSSVAVESGDGLAGAGMVAGSYGSALAVESGGGLAAGGMLTGPYGSGRYLGTHPDQMVNGRPYSWHEDSSLVERYLGQPYSRLGQPYDSQPSTSGLIGSYGRQLGRPSLETFPGSLNFSGSPGLSGPGSDLYRFADTLTALPLGTVESLRPTFVPAQRVGLAVKLPSAFALEANLYPPRGNHCSLVSPELNSETRQGTKAPRLLARSRHPQSSTMPLVVITIV
ncbi:hypothetical protein OSB04_003839 [Centaurea solstitialis]|uniref:FRIGIDA-like protein n=1 Tax=Centaurea solstitialis TaxID=347529 RepID=A0AA38U354_9ASTR|nr:hypothetical protein OSB04_003839 [Centaurea solstitialis]